MYAYSMHMKKNAIINNKQHINENCLMSELWIQEVVKDCASFRVDDGSYLHHLCFDNSTEYDSEVAFDKHLFCSKCCFFMKLNSIVDKKE